MIFIAIICLPGEQFVERSVIQVALMPQSTMIMTLPNSLWLGFGSGLIIGTTPSSSKCCPCRSHPTRSGNKYTRSGDTVTYCQCFSKLFHSQLKFGLKLIYLRDSLLRRLRDLFLEVSVRRLAICYCSLISKCHIDL